MMRMREWPRSQVIVVVLCLCGVTLSIYAVRILQKRHASNLFRQYVLDPVPTSVTHMKADQPITIGGYGYVFRFAINSTDLELIRKSRPFREAEIEMHADSHVGWTWKGLPSSGNLGEIGSGLTVYGTGREPYWFDLESWKNPETHALLQKDKDANISDIQILIYNAELGHAYFIVFHYGGGPVPFFWRKRASPAG
jgi:hypothetical protein